MPSRSILVVDTSPISWQRVGRALQGSPTFITSARSAADAVASVTGGEIALVVGSMRLPDGGGYELARRVRAARPATRVLLLADGPERYDATVGEAAGALGAIDWPCPVDRLRARLEEALAVVDPGEATSDPAPPEAEALPEVAPEPLPEVAPEPLPEAALRPHAFVPDDGVEELPALPLDAPVIDPVEPAALRAREPEPAEVAPEALESIDSFEPVEVPPLPAPPPVARARAPEPPVGDERLATFLPRDWKTLPPVRVDPAVVAPAVERAILEVLPEVVEVVLRQALATSPAFRDLVEAAVDEAVRAQLGPIARSVVRERLAELEAASDDS